MAGRVIQGSFAAAPRPGAAPAFPVRSAAPGRPPATAQPAGTTAVDASVLRLDSGGGRPLPDALQRTMQAAFGADFSEVRVHEGPQAAAIGAIAFTVGNAIYFAPGRYQPQTATGRQLLGHELAHVVQQRAGRVRNPLGSGLAIIQDQALEAEADRLGQRAAALAPTAGGNVPSTAQPVAAQPLLTQQAVAQPRPAGPPAPAFTPPAAAQAKGGAAAGGHCLTIGSYLHRAPGLPAEAAGHTFVAIEAPGGRREAWGFSPADRTFDPRAGLGQAKTGVPGRLHRDDGGFGKPGVVTRSYAIGPEQARAALAKVAEYRVHPPQFSFAGRDCGAFAADVLRAAGLAAPTPLQRPGSMRCSLQRKTAGTTTDQACLAGAAGARRAAAARSALTRPGGPVLPTAGVLQRAKRLREEDDPEEKSKIAKIDTGLNPQTPPFPLTAFHGTFGGRELLLNIFGFLSDRDLLALRLVCKLHKELATRILMARVSAYGVSALDRSLMTAIQQEIARQAQFRLSVDQLTDVGLIHDVTGNRLGKLVATNVGQRSRAFENIPHAVHVQLVGKQKMHNKFWLLGTNTVITGSPNVSHLGLNDNLECIIVIRSTWVQRLFREYFESIRSVGNRGGRVDNPGLTNTLTSFNTQRDSRLRLALAPFLNVRDFIYQELTDDTRGAAVKITIRQFLIDQRRHEAHDILQALVKLQQAGAAVEVVLDFGQFATAEHVKNGCDYLLRQGIKVFLQFRAGKGGDFIMHEKLMLVEFTRNTVTTKRCIIGSAGLTVNVSQNLNFENMISFDEDEIYDYFLHLHEESFKGKWGVEWIAAADLFVIERIYNQARRNKWHRSQFIDKVLDEKALFHLNKNLVTMFAAKYWDDNAKKEEEEERKRNQRKY